MKQIRQLNVSSIVTEAATENYFMKIACFVKTRFCLIFFFYLEAFKLWQWNVWNFPKIYLRKVSWIFFKNYCHMTLPVPTKHFQPKAFISKRFVLQFLRNPVWHGGSGACWPPYQLYRNKKVFNRFGQLSFFYSHKIYFYTFWPNLDKCFAEGHEIWPFCGREV